MATRKIIITACHNLHRIPPIKALREVTGYGLKESKDIIDDVMEGKAYQFSFCERDNMSFDAAFRTLRDVGCIVNFINDSLEQMLYGIDAVVVLKALMKNCIDDNNFDTAKILCETIKEIRYQ